MKKIIAVVILILAAVLAVYFFSNKAEAPAVKKIAEYKDLVILKNPLPGASVSSPLVIEGEARGNWFFEASFPIVLADWDGRIIAQHYAEAKDDPADSGAGWMTTEFVPFSAKLEFESPVFEGAPEEHFSRRGFLILQKDNPSGLPENDDAFEIAVFFSN